MKQRASELSWPFGTKLDWPWGAQAEAQDFRCASCGVEGGRWGTEDGVWVIRGGLAYCTPCATV